MLYAMRSKLLSALFVGFYINLAIAGRWPIHIQRRDGPPAPSSTITHVSTTTSSSPSQSKESRSGTNGGASSTNLPAAASSTAGALESNSTTISTSSSSSATPTHVSITAVTSNINGAVPTASLNNNSLFNCTASICPLVCFTNIDIATATPDQLPLMPTITPGFAVAGVLLMISGIVYTMIGMKNKYLHIFLSAAYLASLSVTVLVIYVMNPPVSNAIQGAYLVAIAMTGLILGGAAVIFTEMTEGLGCLLGGFCFSMWLLVLKPGGLITSTGGKSGFIAAFTLAAFSTSFNHITRPYGLIVFISFGGATTVVLGIDCFSRAGLKEFWVYIWNLNGNLFPLGATTYPLTRGLRVEIAAIVIIFLAGVASQMKLWKIIKEKREQRAAERLADERTMEQEEANVGRRIEVENTEARNQWETVYGDKDAVKPMPSNRDSGVGGVGSQGKGAMSTVTSLRRSGEDDIEMAEISPASPTLTTGAGLVMTSKDQDGSVIIRVARDIGPEPEMDETGKPTTTIINRHSHLSTRSSVPQDPQEEKAWIVGADGEARLEKSSLQRISKRGSGAPEITPLPFKVPELETDDDRSSVATFADDEAAESKRQSKHLSTGSAVLRKLSKRSQRSSKRFSRGEGRSTEDLVIPATMEDDRASSVAATMDGLSDDEDSGSRRSSLGSFRNPARLSRLSLDLNPIRFSEQIQLESISKEAEDASTPQTTASRTIPAVLVGTEILEPEEAKRQKMLESQTEVQKSSTSTTDPRPAPETATVEFGSDKSGKNTPPIDSQPASLSKERLPAQLSKVVMSYRTNEWAKHLSGADAPEFENLKLEPNPVEEEQTEMETAAPVNVDELQQTAENALLPPARTMSQNSIHVATTRSNSGQASRQETNGLPFSQDSMISRSLSPLNTRVSALRSASSPNIPQSIVESPIEDDLSARPTGVSRSSSSYVPFGNSTTLIGKRDNMLRNKTSYYPSPTALASTPEFPSPYTSTNVSQQNSDRGSIHSTAPMMINDDNISLSARRELMRQSSMQSNLGQNSSVQWTTQTYDSHQPRRQSSTPSPMAREQQLASFRASMQQDLQSAVVPKVSIERQRSALWQERQAEEQRKTIEERRKGERDTAFDQRMRRGDMLDAHREALRKMQASANKHA
jgi:hypothetical protein